MPTTYKTLEESVEELIQAAPEVFAALTPKGISVKDYFSRILPMTNNYLLVDISTIADAAVNSKVFLDFIKAHPELHSLPLLIYKPDSFSIEEKPEEQRVEAIKRRYPEITIAIDDDRSLPRLQPAHLPYGDPTATGLWNPLELLIRTNGDLSFYSGLDNGLNGTDMFLYMQHSGSNSNGDVLIGVRPYGEKKDSIKQFLQNMPHGSMIAFYEVAQATIDGKRVGVIETMQTDLLRRDFWKKPLVPNNERRFYTSGENHWLRHTLPQLEAALREAGVEAISIVAMETIFRRTSGGGRFRS